MTNQYDFEVRPPRMKRIKTDSISLRSQDRPVDYGHCGALFVDKYGKDRGDKMYQEVFVESGKNFGWTIASNIQKEKIAMLQYLKMAVPHDLDDVPYYPLWKKWLLYSSIRKQNEPKEKSVKEHQTFKKLKHAILETNNSKLICLFAQYFKIF